MLFRGSSVTGWLLVVVITAASSSVRAESTFPKVKVSNIRKVFDNGEHNAFTDLCKFQGRYYLTFRSCPGGHGVNPTASVIVLASDDLKSWDEVFHFNVPKRDTRDPHFLIFDDQLLVYTGTWYAGDAAPKSYDMNEQLGYVVYTRDGAKWGGPKMVEGTYGHYIWRAATDGKRAYLCGRRKAEFAKTNSRAERDAIVESAMLVSDDGFIFEPIGFFQETFGDETAFLFEDDGSVLAVARSGGGRNAQICRAEPPYKLWERVNLDRYIGGPMVAKWGDRYVVGGRKSIGPAKTSLYWLDGNELREFAELPSGGDNSYPGFIALSPTEAVVSWYSTHEKDDEGRPITAIYMADLEIEGE